MHVFCWPSGDHFKENTPQVNTKLAQSAATDLRWEQNPRLQLREKVQ